MIEVNVPKDIRAYEPTFLFMFTARQTACIALMGVFTIACYVLEKSAGLSPMEYPLFVIPAILIFPFGWIKPYGMKFEQFIKKAYTDNFQAPTKRKYEVENMWDVIMKDAEEEEHRRELEEKLAKADSGVTGTKQKVPENKAEKKSSSKGQKAEKEIEKLSPELKAFR